MALLEDQILSYSILKDDDDDKRPSKKSPSEDADIEADDEFLSPAELRALTSDLAEYERQARDPLAERTAGRRTGPKGVIADKKWADFQQIKQADRERFARHAAAMEACVGREAPAGQSSVSVGATWATSGPSFSSAAERLRGAKEDSGAITESSIDAISEGAGDDNGDGGFMSRYRCQRLRELRAAASAAAAPDGEYVVEASATVALEAAAYPVFGEVVEVAGHEEFLGALDGAPARSWCLVLVWEPFIPVAAWLHASIWPALAAAHPRVLFVAARSAALSESIDVIGLPAVVAYRGGETVEAIVRIQDQLPGGPGASAGAGSGGADRPTAAAVTALLRAKGVYPLGK